jgi:cytochrome P450
MENTKHATPDSGPAWIEQISPADLLHPQEIATRLRQEAPLAWVPAAGMYLATSWDLCHRIANDSDNFESIAIPLAKRLFGTPDVLSTEGDLHASLRQAVGTPVSARAIRSQIESRMRPTAKGLVERLRGQGRAELMAEYFEPISVRCVADSYGFFDVETDTLRWWFHALKSGAVNAATNADGSFADPAGFDDADRARSEIRAYFEEKSKDDPEAPDSVIARWLNTELPDGSTWTIDYILPSMLVVLLGGLQEPGHALGNTFLGLATNPDQLSRVVSDPRLLPKAVAEGLRWMAPLYAGPTRSARHDFTLDGVALKKGDVVRLVYGSANHDSNTFDHPELFDIDRPGHTHLSFGDGRHSCVGSALAPQIARVALEELFAAFPDIALDPAQTAAAIGWPFHGPPQLHVILNRTDR